eukprot:NODE_3138_length_1024_cov_19.607581_g2994_i0.p1 GENE.NODE_3138_length_1024_cov_19.607581_g2994_i0~~NODE_3138_length_1024_cov_19.607581_g2994_i0.p1  ORF type:complete len:319 (-),score=91.02 NODE_3138_length_1024_cov_19.607581_g2994_i0:67-975(-)
MVDNLTPLIGKRPMVFFSELSDNSRAHLESWRPRPTDVIVLTFPKTGTTWLQQIAQQLRSGGSMEFEEISEVQPWLAKAKDVGQDLNEDHPYHPRVFKSHQMFSATTRGAKYLSCMRHPAKVLVSFFHFGKAKGHFAHTSADEFALSADWLGTRINGGNVFQYYLEMWKCRHLPEVLILAYEHMQQDLAGAIQRVAKFMDIPCGEELRGRVEGMCTHGFMMEHADRFDDRWIKRRLRELGTATSKTTPAVSKVTAGHADALGQPALDRLQACWEEIVTPETGLRTYQDMIDQLRKEQSTLSE